MSVSRVIQEIRVHGSAFKTSLASQVIDGELTLSTSQVTAFDFTILDRPNLALTTQAGALFQEGTVITWEDYAMVLTAFRTGGGTEAPTITVEATSDFVDALDQQTGGKNWGNASVSAWATTLIRSTGAQAYVQPGLGEREIERAEPEGDLSDAETSWDVLAEMAKQVGAWLFEYGNRIVLARPSWLVTQTGLRRYSVTWNSWTDHTDGLTSAPEYAWNKDRKLWDGRETLTIQAMDPGNGSTNPLTQARPGDIMHFDGAGNPTNDPTWLVTQVTHPTVTGRPVTIRCARPVDPPEIVPENENGEPGGSTAGVPTGPLGAAGWQGEQLRNASEIVKEAQRRGLPTVAAELAVACAMGESSLRNVGYGDDRYGVTNPDGSLTTSVGLFQQQNSWGSRSDRLTPSKAAGFFYAVLVTKNYRSVTDASSASLMIHSVQINADPQHYARFWNDAKLVVRACIDAGRSSSGGTASGPLGQKINTLMGRYDGGPRIDVDGAYQAQCVDLAAKYVTDMYGIPMVQGNGKDYYAHPVLTSKFLPIPGFKTPRKGDIVSWSGSHGAFPNGGYGHVAIYSHSTGGQHYFLTQNPTAPRTLPLSTAGVLGLMRPRS